MEKKNYRRYCAFCGEELSMYVRPVKYIPEYNGEVTYTPEIPAYDSETGKRLFEEVYECPNYYSQKRYFFGIFSWHKKDLRHSRYFKKKEL